LRAWSSLLQKTLTKARLSIYFWFRQHRQQKFHDFVLIRWNSGRKIKIAINCTLIAVILDSWTFCIGTQLTSIQLGYQICLDSLTLIAITRTLTHYHRHLLESIQLVKRELTQDSTFPQSNSKSWTYLNFYFCSINRKTICQRKSCQKVKWIRCSRGFQNLFRNKIKLYSKDCCSFKALEYWYCSNSCSVLASFRGTLKT
jgi:hypothetical protein